MSLAIVLPLLGMLLQTPAAPAGATVSGRVTEDGTGKPVAAAEVTLFGTGRAAHPLESTRTTSTDADGRYAFEGVEPGEYRVTVRKAGFAGPDVTENHSLVVRGASGARMDFALKRGAAIVGRVLDDRGEPVVEASVMVLRKPPARMSHVAVASNLPLFPAGQGQMAQTNDLGEFRVFGLLPHDAYYVRAMPRMHFGAEGSPRGSVMLPTFYPGAVDPEAAQTIAVGPGETSGDVVIRMITVPAFQVSGIVTDDGGRPVVNALVRLVSDDVKRTPFMAPMISQAHTDSSGRFTLMNVVDGTYTLIAIAPVVTSSPAQGGRTWSSGGGASGSFSFGGSVVGGTVAEGVTTEMRNGVTTEYRESSGTRVQLTVNQANVNGVEITVRQPR